MHMLLPKSAVGVVRSMTCCQYCPANSRAVRRSTASHTAVKWRRRHVCCSSSGSAQGYPHAEQGPDVATSMLSSCLQATARLTDSVVSRLADALQSVAPPTAPRPKVELSVKGALVLLLLGLLKGVISLVLLVGCAALALFTSTQVFGWNGVLLHQDAPDVYGRDPHRHHHQQRQQGYGQHSSQRKAYEAYTAQQGADWAQQQHGRIPPGGFRQQQGDIVDVFQNGPLPS